MHTATTWWKRERSTPNAIERARVFSNMHRTSVHRDTGPAAAISRPILLHRSRLLPRRWYLSQGLPRSMSATRRAVTKVTRTAPHLGTSEKTQTSIVPPTISAPACSRSSACPDRKLVDALHQENTLKSEPLHDLCGNRVYHTLPTQAPAISTRSA